MDRVLFVEIAVAAERLTIALGDVQAMVDQREGGADLQELLRHAHDLTQILSDAVKRLGDVREAPAALAIAAKLSAELEGLERDIATKSAN
jgi:hypothetical protein